MADDLEQDPGLRLGVAAALARKYAEDQARFLEGLAALLVAVLPEVTKVERGGFFGRGEVRRVEVEVDEARYALAAERGRLAASRTRVVRGIALKTEPRAVDAWVDELGAALEARVADSAAARLALERLVG